jgi:hypothetical protein
MIKIRSFILVLLYAGLTTLAYTPTARAMLRPSRPGRRLSRVVIGGSRQPIPANPALAKSLAEKAIQKDDRATNNSKDASPVGLAAAAHPGWDSLFRWLPISGPSESTFLPRYLLFCSLLL